MLSRSSGAGRRPRSWSTFSPGSGWWGSRKLPSSSTPSQALAAAASCSPSSSLQFPLAPHVEAPLDALRVGVQGAVEASLRPAHLAQGPLQRVHAHPAQLLLAGGLPGVQVGAGQQRVVVEHLLEVGHGPGVVDAVAVKAAAELVVDPAAGHRPQCLERDRCAPPQQQELQQRGLGELRRAPEAAVVGVEALAGPRDRLVQHALLQRLLRAGVARRCSPRCSRSRSPPSWSCGRSSRQAWAMALSTSRQAGIPVRGSGGK